MDTGTLPGFDVDKDSRALNGAAWYAENLTHLASLMHALALQHLRGDWDLNNIIPHNSAAGPPPLVCVLLR